MSYRIACATTVVLLGSTCSFAGVVDRAEAKELKLSNGTSVPRVLRDVDGHVTRLNLSGMTLSQGEFMEIGELDQLKTLVLWGTNVTNEDLSHLSKCKHLEHLNLTSTEVTDRAIDHIFELTSLKSLCLGNVRITPQAIEKLKKRPELRFGYFQRKSD